MKVALLARFPRFRAPSKSLPVIPQEVRAAYPELSADFRQLDEVVLPAFEEQDLAALVHQNRHRRQQLFVILGSALITGLGGLQAAFPGQQWPGLLLAILGIALAASGRWARERMSHTSYLRSRIQAERLRAVHFQYLAAIGDFAGPSRTARLRRAVLAIRRGKELE